LKCVFLLLLLFKCNTVIKHNLNAAIKHSSRIFLKAKQIVSCVFVFCCITVKMNRRNVCSKRYEWFSFDHMICKFHVIFTSDLSDKSELLLHLFYHLNMPGLNCSDIHLIQAYYKSLRQLCACLFDIKADTSIQNVFRSLIL
jgi:hypothetical protein